MKLWINENGNNEFGKTTPAETKTVLGHILDVIMAALLSVVLLLVVYLLICVVLSAFVPEQPLTKIPSSGWIEILEGRVNDGGSVSIDTLFTYGKKPSLELLREAKVPYVFPNSGSYCKPFRLNDGLFRKLTDEDMPDGWLYADLSYSWRYLEYEGELYIVSQGIGMTYVREPGVKRSVPVPIEPGVKKVVSHPRDVVFATNVDPLRENGKKPSLELLREASIQTVYDEDGRSIPLFDSATGEAVNVKLPKVVYVSSDCSAHYVDLYGALSVLIDDGDQYQKIATA